MADISFERQFGAAAPAPMQLIAARSITLSSYLKTAEITELAGKLKLAYFPSALSAYSAVRLGTVCK